MITVALLPFFAYYAAWGFLGDTVRQYSRVTLDMAPFGESGNVLDVLDFALAAAFRRDVVAGPPAGQGMQKRARISFWQIVVVICETNWIFVGLYVICAGRTIVGWIMSRNIFWTLQAMGDGVATPVSTAFAAPTVPVELASHDPRRS